MSHVQRLCMYIFRGSDWCADIKGGRKVSFIWATPNITAYLAAGQIIILAGGRGGASSSGPMHPVTESWRRGTHWIGNSAANRQAHLPALPAEGGDGTHGTHHLRRIGSFVTGLLDACQGPVNDAISSVLPFSARASKPKTQGKVLA